MSGVTGLVCFKGKQLLSTDIGGVFLYNSCFLLAKTRNGSVRVGS